MIPVNKKFIVSWDELYRDSKALAWRLSTIKFDAIVCVTRGGLFPAGIIAQELNIRLIDTICISSYDINHQRGALRLIKSISPQIAELDQTKILVIDDLADSGETLRMIRRLLPHSHYACVYAKPDGAATVDTFLTQISQETWVVFPQEDD